MEASDSMTTSSALRSLFVIGWIVLSWPSAAAADEQPYFVTYNAQMEERGDLEITTEPVLGQAHDINDFSSYLAEFEYGTTAWWTTEFYFDWQHTRNEDGSFTGIRFENRFRPWIHEHRINPVFYVEYEHVSEADKTMREVVGFDGKADFAEPVNEVRHDYNHELELKLIASSLIKGWDVAENFIGEKILSGGGQPWEFGYAIATSRPLSGSLRDANCHLCLGSVHVGVEAYGGLGTASDFTLKGTSHYIAALVGWKIASGTLLRFSPGWGLTDDSVGTVWRVGFSQEIEDMGRAFGKAFGKK
jgi:hypothetical protein